MSLVVGRLAHVEQMVEASPESTSAGADQSASVNHASVNGDELAGVTANEESSTRGSRQGMQRVLHSFAPGLFDSQDDVGLIALISLTAPDPVLRALEAMKLGATIIELIAHQEVEVIPEPGAFESREVELSAGLVSRLVTAIITETGLPVITSVLDEELLRCAVESGTSGLWSAPGVGDAIEMQNAAKNVGELILNVAIDPGPLDASDPAMLSLMLDFITELTASGETVVASIHGGSDAEIAAMASLALSRGARTLRTVSVTPAIRAALVTAAIMDAD
jgi:hypothetical protein